MNTVLALAGVVIKELLVMGSISFFNDVKIARYLKEICLLLIWISALVIAIATTARQIPAERENRTIFPLLAKPVTRAHVVIGKFAGCWLACGIALLVFYLFFGIVSGAREHHWPIAQFIQAAWLQWVMLGVVVALVLLVKFDNLFRGSAGDFDARPPSQPGRRSTIGARQNHHLHRLLSHPAPRMV